MNPADAGGVSAYGEFGMVYSAVVDYIPISGFFMSRGPESPSTTVKVHPPSSLQVY